MANPITKSLISAVIALCLISSSFASSDVPFMVAHKKATTKRLKSGIERVSVSIDISNQGTSTAFDVTLSDDSWAKELFDVVSGNISQTWERLDAGGILSHSFELDAKVKGMFYGAPAILTFRIPTKAALQEAYSTPIWPLDVLAEKPAENKLDLAKRLLTKYGSQLSVVCIVVLFVYLITSPSSASKGSKKKR